MKRVKRTYKVECAHGDSELEIGNVLDNKGIWVTHWNKWEDEFGHTNLSEGDVFFMGSDQIDAMIATLREVKKSLK